MLLPMHQGKVFCMSVPLAWISIFLFSRRIPADILHVATPNHSAAIHREPRVPARKDQDGQHSSVRPVLLGARDGGVRPRFEGGMFTLLSSQAND